MREITPRRHEYYPAIGDTDAELVYTPTSEESNLRDYWKMVAKRRRLVVLVLLMAIGLGVFITVWSTPLYTAAVMLKIESGPPSSPGLGEMAIGGDQYFGTQVALLKSRALAARVITDLHLVSHPKFVDITNPLEQLLNWVPNRLQSTIRQVSNFVSNLSGTTPTQREGLSASSQSELGVQPRFISRYLKYIEVEPVRNSSLVRVMVTTVDPRLSQELAAVHSTTFIRKNLETRFELSKEVREFLEKKLAELKVKVEASEQALQQFRRANGVVSLEGSQNIDIERMVDVNKRLTEARARRIELESLSRMVKTKNFEYLSQVATNSFIQQLKGRLETLDAEESRLATIYKPDHPRREELRQQIKEARQRLNGEIGNVIRGVESDYASARAREGALESEAERQQQAALNLKELGVQYTLLQGELDANRSVFDTVMKRLNETSIRTEGPVSNIQIAEPAERPLSPAYPKVPLNMLVAVVLGLFFGVGLAFLLEHVDATMRTPDDVWRAANIPTLGVVPHLKAIARREYSVGRLPTESPLRRLAHPWVTSRRSSSTGLMVSHHPLSLIAESYRAIRTVLLLGHAEAPPQVILVTSSHPGEGKTTITLNLAITLAQSGRTVVVIDGDLRRGNCHSHLGVQNRYGLTHFLTDSLPLDVCVQSTAVAGLSLLTRGVTPPNPTDLLASEKMQEMLAVLRQRFDFVLIDSPPALPITDATVLSVVCDGVLLVLRNQSTTTETARRAVERLQAVGARILGAVINGINIRDPDYAGYRGYYSYYSAAQKEM